MTRTPILYPQGIPRWFVRTMHVINSRIYCRRRGHHPQRAKFFSLNTGTHIYVSVCETCGTILARPTDVPKD